MDKKCIWKSSRNIANVIDISNIKDDKTKFKPMSDVLIKHKKGAEKLFLLYMT